MKIENFCSFVRSIREKHISRREFSKLYPWHENSLKGYEKDRLPDVDYLYAIHQVTDYPFLELIEKRLLAGILNLKQEDLKFNLRGVVKAVATTSSDLYRVNDASMEPTLIQGGEYEVDSKDKFLSEGRLYAIKIRHNITVRRIQFDISSRILLSADNPNFSTLILSKEEQTHLEVLGRVTHVTNPV